MIAVSIYSKTHLAVLHCLSPFYVNCPSSIYVTLLRFSSINICSIKKLEIFSPSNVISFGTETKNRKWVISCGWSSSLNCITSFQNQQLNVSSFATELNVDLTTTVSERYDASHCANLTTIPIALIVTTPTLVIKSLQDEVHFLIKHFLQTIKKSKKTSEWWFDLTHHHHCETTPCRYKRQISSALVYLQKSVWIPKGTFIDFMHCSWNVNYWNGDSYD